MHARVWWEEDGGGHMAGWLGLPIVIGSPRLPLYIYIYIPWVWNIIPYPRQPPTRPPPLGSWRSGPRPHPIRFSRAETGYGSTVRFSPTRYGGPD
jgi:hypothetical protein